ncbi:hypothetical protein HDU98_002224, partial [Podochytrium sp. JEL0797]
MKIACFFLSTLPLVALAANETTQVQVMQQPTATLPSTITSLDSSTSPTNATLPTEDPLSALSAGVVMAQAALGIACSIGCSAAAATPAANTQSPLPDAAQYHGGAGNSVKFDA